MPTYINTYIQFKANILIHTYIHTQHTYLSFRALSTAGCVALVCQGPIIIHTYIHIYILTYIHNAYRSEYGSIPKYINTYIHTYIYNTYRSENGSMLNFGRVDVDVQVLNGAHVFLDGDIALVRVGNLLYVYTHLPYIPTYGHNS